MTLLTLIAAYIGLFVLTRILLGVLAWQTQARNRPAPGEERPQQLTPVEQARAYRAAQYRATAERPGIEARGDDNFILLLRTKDGHERLATADVVIDTSGRMVGMVSERDVIRELGKNESTAGRTAADVMTRTICKCAPEDTEGEIMERMVQGRQFDVSELGITYYIRGEFYREKAKDYVGAAIATGVSERGIMFGHQ